MRTGALETGPTAPTFSRHQKDILNRSGTWIKHSSPKKMNVQENSALKEAQQPLMIDSMLTGVDMSDLNTPDIKFEEFDFQGGRARSNVNVERSATSQSTTCVISSHGDEGVSIEATATDATYAFFDMSPGMRDLLQTVSPHSQDDLHADQHEQRINIEQYQDSLSATNEQDPLSATNEELILPGTIAELDYCMQDDFDTMEDPYQPAQTELSDPPYNCPPQLSITEGDTEVSLPQGMLEELDRLFPLSNPLQLNNVCTTELDMLLGQSFDDNFTGDLLSESLQQSGLFQEELESIAFEDESKEEFLLVQPNTLMPNICATQTGNFLLNQTAKSSSLTLKQECLQSHVAINTSEATLSNANNNSTPVVQNLSSSCCVPKTPVKKRQRPVNTTPLSQPTVKRQRRASKKPLRFRELYTDGEVIDSELSESISIRESRFAAETSDEDIENVNIATPSTSGILRKGEAKVSVAELSEEQKYHRIRILNNEASKRCRLKRKATVKETEQQLKELEERNLQLKAKQEALQKLKDKFQVFVTDYFKKQLGSAQKR